MYSIHAGFLCADIPVIPGGPVNPLTASDLDWRSRPSQARLAAAWSKFVNPGQANHDIEMLHAFSLACTDNLIILDLAV